MNPREEPSSAEISAFEAWAAINLKSHGNYEAKIKELLYRISLHLHPRIVTSLSYDAENSTLKININEKCSQEFIKIIMRDLQAFNPQQQDGGFAIRIPETDFESVVEKNYPLDKEAEHIRIARVIKNTTDEFDYEITEKKPSGDREGVKLGNAYIKKMNRDDSDLIDLFNYAALHKFFGTKSPQVDLIVDENDELWMVSRSLSQTYRKKEKIKTKKFTILDSRRSSKEEYSIISSINMKSVGKFMLLAVIFSLRDLHSNNIGIVSSENTSKLSIVDHFNDQEVLPDLSVATSWEELFNLVENEYRKNVRYFGAPLVAKFISMLRKDIPNFVQAVDAILQPLTENKHKTKSIFRVNRQHTIFENKSQTFAEALEKAYEETIEKLDKIGFDPSSTEFYTTPSDQYTIEEILKKQKEMVKEAGLNLQKAVNLLNKIDAYIQSNHNIAIQQQILTDYDADLINALMKRRVDFSNTFEIALHVAIDNNNERFLCYLFEQVNINQYLLEHEQVLLVIRQGLLILKTIKRNLAEKILNAVSMVNQLNLFCLPENDIRAGIVLYANTSQFVNVVNDYLKYRITTFDHLIEFISLLSEMGTDQDQLWTSQKTNGMAILKSLLMKNLSLANIVSAFAHVHGFYLSSDELTHIAQIFNPNEFLIVLNNVSKHNIQQVAINVLAHDAMVICLNKAVQQHNFAAVKLCLGNIGSNEVTIQTNNTMDEFTIHYIEMHNINVKFNQNNISEHNLIGLIHTIQSHMQYLKVTDYSNPFITLCDNLLNVYSEYKTKVSIISPDRLANLCQLVSQVGKTCYLYMSNKDTKGCFDSLSQTASRLCQEVTETHKKEGALSFTSDVVSAIPLPFFQNLKNPGGLLSSKLSTLIQEAINNSKISGMSLTSSQ